ncbi:MAG: ferrous iron transport protein B [Christensenellales bacterium]|jgi:ferrous iron transport protein B
MSQVWALIGNQNSGKTTLFNALTGSNQHVGNFPGVTVEKKEGTVRNHPEITLVDLPGIYSLSPYTPEEVVTADFLLREKPRLVINILDATNIQRGLYLSLQLMELGLPMVLALNMMDEMEVSGFTVDVKGLEKALEIPVIPISASKGQGIDALLRRALDTADRGIRPGNMDFCRGEVHRAIHSTAHIVEDHAQALDIPPRYAATKLIEGDPSMVKLLGISAREQDIICHIVEDMEAVLRTDREAALADMRYDAIARITGPYVHTPGDTKAQRTSIAIDRLLTHKYLGMPLFFGIMLLIFWMTFDVLGKLLQDATAYLLGFLIAGADSLLTAAQINPTLHSLVIDGIFAGVSAVLSFLPVIVVLFFFLSILEDTGYMARVAFMMDRPLRKIGLSGRSVVPMLIGLGCSVPAIMATRTLGSQRERRMTMLLIPFMSCSAKLPIYALFTDAFFPAHKALVMLGLYAGGILLGVLSGWLLRRMTRCAPAPFVLELPAYRFPSLRSVLLALWEKARDFLHKAFTVIFLATLVIWLLQSFDFRGNLTLPENSALAALGRLAAPLLTPLGFGSWQAATALIAGLTAKEAVISTLAVLSGSAGLTALFTPESALSFLVFTLLYPPCVASMAVIRREWGAWWGLPAVIAFQLALAWLASFAFRGITLLGGMI